MRKEECLEIDYQPLNNDAEGIQTLYKRFDNGTMYIFQFNDEGEYLGVVFLTEAQAQSLASMTDTTYETNRLKKVKVSREVADALDKQSKDEWNKQFSLISQCKGFSGNGVLYSRIWTDEFKALEQLQPLEYAKCLIVGYEVIEA